MTLRMLASAGLVSALSLAPLSGQMSDGAALPPLAKLLQDRAVTFVSAGSLFLPGKDGRSPRLVSGDKHWLVYRSGKALGLIEKPDVDPTKIKARVVDFRKDHPESFAVPGFVDADSRWFRSQKDLQDRTSVPTERAADGLELWQKGWNELVDQSGVTSVFVPASVNSQASGEGALVGLATRTPSVVGDGALAWRLSSPATRGTSLTRANVAKGLASAMGAARKYSEAREKYDKDLAEYKKKRKEFLAYYKKNPLKKGEEIKEATPTRRPVRRGRLPKTKEELEKMLQRFPPAMRDRIRKTMEARMKQAADAEKAAKAAAAAKKTPAKPTTDKKKAPPRPKRPKPFKRDDKQEAMLRVLSGDAALRVEVHRKGEILALLDLAKEEGLDRLVVVGGTEAWKVAKELRVAGASVVLRPETIPSKGFDTLPEQLAASAAKLAEEGVPVAFGSAGRERGRALPLFAARAVANGMDEAMALQALTQGGIESSGMPAKKDVDQGVVVWSGNPLATTSRPLALVRGRRTRKIAEAGGSK